MQAWRKQARRAAFADMPTWRECGYALDFGVSIGLVAPKSMEPGVQVRVHDAFKAALETPAVRALIEKYDMIPGYLDGASTENALRAWPPT
jgi:tripartite-type tricarboxylate transporter receptor subunit TctC